MQDKKEISTSAGSSPMSDIGSSDGPAVPKPNTPNLRSLDELEYAESQLLLLNDYILFLADKYAVECGCIKILPDGSQDYSRYPEAYSESEWAERLEDASEIECELGLVGYEPDSHEIEFLRGQLYGLRWVLGKIDRIDFC